MPLVVVQEAVNCDYSAGHILILKASTVSEFLGKE